MITVGDDGTSHNLCAPDVDTWSLTLRLGSQSHIFNLAQLKAIGSERVPMKIECVSAGFIAGGRNKEMVYTGLPLSQLFASFVLPADAQTVIFRSKAPAMGGPDDEKHKTALDLEYCLKSVLLTWGLNDEPLPYPNGGPLRSTVGPDRYFYKGIKWLEEIEVTHLPLSECLGTWETYGGYHNVGLTGQNPEQRFQPLMRTIEGFDEGGKDATALVPEGQWLEQFETRLKARDLSRLVLAKGDLMGINLNRDYAGVRFVDGNYCAKIRGTTFKNVNFIGVDFRGVNLSLSRFPGCRFSVDGDRPSNLSCCDMEGAHFTGADLTGTIMRDACLTGVHFYLQSHREKNEKRKAALVKGLDLRGSYNLDAQQVAWLKQDGAIFDE